MHFHHTLSKPNPLTNVVSAAKYHRNNVVKVPTRFLLSECFKFSVQSGRPTKGSYLFLSISLAFSHVLSVCLECFKLSRNVYKTLNASIMLRQAHRCCSRLGLFSSLKIFALSSQPFGHYIDIQLTLFSRSLYCYALDMTHWRWVSLFFLIRVCLAAEKVEEDGKERNRSGFFFEFLGGVKVFG